MVLSGSRSACTQTGLAYTLHCRYGVHRLYNMYRQQNDVFEFDGKLLIVKREPTKLWPCQHCALCESCTADRYGTAKFPACRAEHRGDNTDVVFFEYVQQKNRGHKNEQ